VNALSATLTFPAAFHGSSAERQSPRCFTSITGPLPRTVPATFGSAPSGAIGFVRMLESGIVYDTTWRSSSSVQPVSSYGLGSSGL
jgi:hypothetical protein